MSCSVSLQRQSYFPGNMVPFTINVVSPVAISNACVNLYATLYQRWVTHHTRTSGSGKHRRTHRYTVSHNKTTILVNMDIPVQHNGTAGPGQPLQGAFMLAPNALPTVNHANCQISYALRARIFSSNFPGGMVQSPDFPMVLLVPLPFQKWQEPSQRVEDRHQDVTCCCCCPCGSVDMQFTMSKTVIALDRDTLVCSVTLNNTNGKQLIDKVTFVLHCVGQVHAASGGHVGSFSAEAGRQDVVTAVEAGETKTVQGVIQLLPMAPPSFKSPIIDIEYFVTVLVSIDWADDPSISFRDILVGHTVDMGNMFQLDAFQSFHPMMNPTNFNQPIMYQPPPPPPPGQHYGFDMAPPQFFTSMPPIEFVQLPPDSEGETGAADAAAANNNNDNNQMMMMPPPPPFQQGQHP